MAFLIANSLAIVASIGSFVLSLIQLWHGSPAAPEHRRIHVRRAVGLSIVSFILLAFVSVRLHQNIQTVEQSGTLEYAPMGSNQIYYPVPYKSAPYLTLRHRDTASYGERPPRLTEQRPDSFSVQIEPDSHVFDWTAVGRESP